MRTTVLCHGVFDLLNTGHVEHLRQASEMGNRLIVSVLADRYIVKDKRPNIYNESERLALVEAVRYVDQVILCEAYGPLQILEELRPDLYVRGHDYIGKRMPESDLLEKLGIPVKYTERSLPHSTDIIKQIYAICREHPSFK